MTAQEAQAELESIRPKEGDAWMAYESEIAKWNGQLSDAQQVVNTIIMQRRSRLEPFEKAWLPLKHRTDQLKSFLKTQNEHKP